MEEERRLLDRAQRKAEKTQQEIVLNRRGTTRPRLSFDIKPKIM